MNSINSKVTKRDRRKRSTTNTSRDKNEQPKRQIDPVHGDLIDQRAPDPMNTEFKESLTHPTACSSEPFDAALALHRRYSHEDACNTRPIDFLGPYPEFSAQPVWQSSTSSAFQQSGEISPQSLPGCGVGTSFTLTPVSEASLEDRLSLTGYASASSDDCGRLCASSGYPCSCSASRVLSDTSTSSEGFVKFGDSTNCFANSKWYSPSPKHAGSNYLSKESTSEGIVLHGQHMTQTSDVGMRPSAFPRPSNKDEAPRNSRMVLEHVQPDLVERVLSLVLTSNSTIDVKISSQDDPHDSMRS